MNVWKGKVYNAFSGKIWLIETISIVFANRDLSLITSVVINNSHYYYWYRAK